MKTGRIRLRGAASAFVVAILAAGGLSLFAGASLAHEVGEQPGGAQVSHRADPAAITPPADSSAAAVPAVWWIILNNPAYCGGLCGLDDLAAAQSGAKIFYAAGLGDRGDGAAGRGQRHEPGRSPEGADARVFVGGQSGTPDAAEAYTVVRPGYAVTPDGKDQRQPEGDCGVASCADLWPVTFMPNE